jgi:hypothetical protein
MSANLDCNGFDVRQVLKSDVHASDSAGHAFADCIRASDEMAFRFLRAELAGGVFYCIGSGSENFKNRRTRQPALKVS